uniref:Uncharacterized protein n=2 Tax=Auxenochlorella protothecoides TaxID=3075 RepID=A0A1D2ADI2_AUXPR
MNLSFLADTLRKRNPDWDVKRDTGDTFATLCEHMSRLGHLTVQADRHGKMIVASRHASGATPAMLAAGSGPSKRRPRGERDRMKRERQRSPPGSPGPRRRERQRSPPMSPREVLDIRDRRLRRGDDDDGDRWEGA